jgi:hypothetical protein
MEQQFSPTAPITARVARSHFSAGFLLWYAHPLRPGFQVMVTRLFFLPAEFLRTRFSRPALQSRPLATKVHEPSVLPNLIAGFCFLQSFSVGVPAPDKAIVR